MRKVPAAATVSLIAWATIATVLRTARFPNDFAEAHWLLDYRFGLVKRGLVGTVMTVLAQLHIISPTRWSIAVISFASFAVFCVVLLAVTYRVLDRSDWSDDALLCAAAFVTSPFVVTSAHLMGYFDHIVIVLTLVSVWLVLRERRWHAACLMALAVLVHEETLLVGLPLVLVATYLTIAARATRSRMLKSYLPFLLPVVMFMAIGASESLLLDPARLRHDLVQRLTAFPFIEEDMNIFLPEWLTTSVMQSYREQGHAFLRRLSDPGLLWRVLPTVLAMVVFTLRRFRSRLISVEVALLMLVVCAPLLMHAVAWDTARIWTYTIIGAFGCAWVFGEVKTPGLDHGRPWLAWLAASAIVLNVFERYPLLDRQVDRFTDVTRAWLYAPLLIGTALVLVRPLWRHRRGRDVSAT